LRAGDQVVEELERVTYANGNPLLQVKTVGGQVEAEAMLRNREGTVFLVIPEGFSDALRKAREGDRTAKAALTFGGDLTNPYYALGAILATSTVDSVVQDVTGWDPVIDFIEEPLGGSAARSEFETYVPGVLVFAVIMLIFSASMAVAREIEAGTLRRLLISRMNAFDWLGGITASQVIIGIVAILLSFSTAVALGFRSQGPFWIAILVAVFASLSVVGVGMVVASFANTVSRAFVIANFPLGLFMFFSGAVFPIPRVIIFTIGDRAISLYDILPPTHAVSALNKVLNLGAGIGDILFELSALVFLTAVYFAAGVWVFQSRHLRSVG
jgi:ABC-2 type transport system permease protein